MAKRTNRRRTNTVATLLSLTAIAAYVLNLDVDNTQESATPVEQAHTADRFASGVKINQFNARGEIDFTLHADSIEYFDRQFAQRTLTDNYATAINRVENFDDSSPSETEFSREGSANNHHQNQTAVGYAKLTQPILTLFSQKDQAEVCSNIAYLNTLHHLQLESDVSIYESKNKSLLTTEALSIDTNLRQFFTKEPVTYSNEFSLSTAIGMEGNLLEGRWRLLSDVRSKIQPIQPTTSPTR